MKKKVDQLLQSNTLKVQAKETMNGPPRIHSLKLTYHLQMGHPKRKFIFQPLIFRGKDVSFREGSPCKPIPSMGLLYLPIFGGFL